MHPTRLVLNFNQDLDPAGAKNLANYRLVGPGRDGRLGTRDDLVIRLRKATYDPVTRSVTLRPKVRLPLRDRFRLTVLDIEDAGYCRPIREPTGRRWRWQSRRNRCVADPPRQPRAADRLWTVQARREGRTKVGSASCASGRAVVTDTLGAGRRRRADSGSSLGRGSRSH